MSRALAAAEHAYRRRVAFVPAMIAIGMFLAPAAMGGTYYVNQSAQDCPC
jgi:hypothetical protein